MSEQTEEKSKIISTLPVSELADALGINMDTTMSYIASGDIIAIECGGTNMPNEYFVTEAEIDRAKVAIAEKIEKARQAAEEADAAKHGRKVMYFTIPTLDPAVFVSHDLKITWAEHVDDMTLRQVIDAAAKHYDLDFTEAKKMKVRSVGRETTTLQTKVSDLEFCIYSKENENYYIAHVEFFNEGDEKTPGTQQGKEKEPETQAQVISESPDVESPSKSLPEDASDKKNLEAVASIANAVRNAIKKKEKTTSEESICGDSEMEMLLDDIMNGIEDINANLAYMINSVGDISDAICDAIYEAKDGKISMVELIDGLDGFKRAHSSVGDDYDEIIKLLKTRKRDHVEEEEEEVIIHDGCEGN